MAGNDLVHAVHAPNIAKEAPPTTYGKLFEITTSTKNSILFVERPPTRCRHCHLLIKERLLSTPLCRQKLAGRTYLMFLKSIEINETNKVM